MGHLDLEHHFQSSWSEDQRNFKLYDCRSSSSCRLILCFVLAFCLHTGDKSLPIVASSEGEFSFMVWPLSDFWNQINSSWELLLGEWELAANVLRLPSSFEIKESRPPGPQGKSVSYISELERHRHPEVPQLHLLL